MHENKKICKGCGRNRRLGKFTKRSSSPDGKYYYCKDCVKILNKNYTSTIKGKNKTKETIKKWKEKNKDKIKESNREYYQKNKQRILYNKKVNETRKKSLINNDFGENKVQKKINKRRKEYNIVINPKRKQ